jgi:hypothetical protein
MPTAAAPPSWNATTAMATVKVASAVQVAAKDSCARRRSGHRAVADKARADAASRLRTRIEQLADSNTRCTSERGNATPEADHKALTFR